MRTLDLPAPRLKASRSLARTAALSLLVASSTIRTVHAQQGASTASSWPDRSAVGPPAVVDSDKLYPLFAPELLREPIRVPLLAPSPLPQSAEGKWYQSDSFKRTIAPAALITAGLLAYGDGRLLNREAMREWRNTFIPEFHDNFDDYTQFLSGFLALGLNAAGVPGQHNLLRATGTYAMSQSIVFVAVHTGKELMAVKRPDGSANNAFPSGHTAASFASARFLDREYGHISYLYSLTGYSLAAYTGVMRQLNNRHWMSDVFVGAGVGLLSTDIAYVLMEEIFDDKGRNPPRAPSPERARGNPSYLDFRIGYADQAGDLEDIREFLEAEQGWTAGFEGAFFFNNYFGVGGEISVSGFPINTENFVPENDSILLVADEVVTQPFGSQSVYAGPFFNLPLAERWAVTGKLTAGWSEGAHARVTIKVKEEFEDELGSEVPIALFEPSAAFGVAAGVAVRVMVSERIGLRIFGEYNHSKPDYVIRGIANILEDGTIVPGPTLDFGDVDFSYFSLGASVSAMLW